MIRITVYMAYGPDMGYGADNWSFLFLSGFTLNDSDLIKSSGLQHKK